jgi:hypothetical protein
MSARYGVAWPDGSITGAITDSQRLAAAYAKNHDGCWYEADAGGDPVAGQAAAPAAAEACAGHEVAA